MGPVALQLFAFRNIDKRDDDAINHVVEVAVWLNSNQIAPLAILRFSFPFERTQIAQHHGNVLCQR